VRRIDNSAVLASQIDKLVRLRAARDPHAVEAALAALSAGASSGQNLVPLAIAAARARATVGEISDALEKAFGRHRPESGLIAGIYAPPGERTSEAIDRVRMMIADFIHDEGRRPSILVAKLGQDGHDRGQKVIASAFSDLGFEVELGPLFASPEETARLAAERDVHVIGVSSLAATHLTLVAQLRAALQSIGRGDVMVVVGGVIPQQDYDGLLEAGVSQIFPTGTPIPEAAAALLSELNRRLGYSQIAPVA